MTISPLPSKTLLLDLDGTLLDADPWPLRLDFVLNMVRELKKVTGSSIKAYSTLKRIRDAVLTTPKHRDKAFLPLLQRAMQAYHETTGRSPTEIITLTETVFPRLERRFKPIPGAIELVQWLRGKANLILATNPVWSKTIIAHRMRWAGIDPDWFCEITSANDYHHHKPHVEYYAEILSRQNLIPARCMHVGNDWTQDTAAMKLGIQVYILDFSKKAARKQIKPSQPRSDGILTGSVGNLKAVLETWLSQHP